MANNNKEKRIRSIIYERDDYTCQYCGKSFEESKLSIDHITPKSLGGDLFDESNLITSCRVCNSVKGTFDLETFRLRSNLRASGIGFLNVVQAIKLIESGIDLKIKKDFKFHFELTDIEVK